MTLNEFFEQLEIEAQKERATLQIDLSICWPIPNYFPSTSGYDCPITRVARSLFPTYMAGENLNYYEHAARLLDLSNEDRDLIVGAADNDAGCDTEFRCRLLDICKPVLL